MNEELRERLVQHLGSHVSQAASVLGGHSVESFMRSFDGRDMPCSRFVIDPGIEFLFIASSGYPGIPPVLLVTPSGMDTVQLSMDWELEDDPEERLVRSLSKIFTGSPPYTLAFGPSKELLVTNDPIKAEKAGWEPFFSGDSQATQDIQESLFARSSGILSRSLCDRSAMIVGLGSGGSYVSENLVRSGLGRVILIDGDIVEPHNLCRTAYDISDIGHKKVSAMTRKLLNINPSLGVTECDGSLSDLGHDTLEELVSETDLIIALTDDPYAQSRLNHYAYYFRKPALFAALYRGAKGGEVIICIPRETPCIECSTGGLKSTISRPIDGVDYGTGRLPGEQAISADIHHLDTATVKLALSILLRDDEDLALSKFINSALEKKFTYLCMSMVPDYWVFPHIFGETPGQHGYQSVWLTVESSDDCSLCSPSATCEDPRLFPLEPPGNLSFNSS